MRWTNKDLDSLVRGERKPWEAMLLLLRDLVRRWASNMGLGAADRERVYDRALMLVLSKHGQKIRECRHANSFPAYIGRIVRDTAIDVARLRRSRCATDVGSRDKPLELDRLPESEDGGSTKPNPADLMLALRGRLRTLQWDVVWYRCVERMSWQDVTDSLSLPTKGAAKQVFRRAMRRLARG